MIWIVAVIGVALVAVVSLTMVRQQGRPDSMVKQVADDFWAAVAAGDRPAAAALLAPGANLNLEQVMRDFQGIQYTRGNIQLTDAEANRCGLRYVAVGGFADRGGTAHSELLYLKQVGGRWLIHQNNGELCE
jgi:hypothetical protein